MATKKKTNECGVENKGAVVGDTLSSPSRSCRICEREWSPHISKPRWANCGFDVPGALNGLLEVKHSSHAFAVKHGAAHDAYLALGFHAVSPSLETLAQCESKLRAGGFTEEEIGSANLDGEAVHSVASRVAGRAKLALMLQHAVAAAQEAQELHWRSADPCSDAALRVIRLALLAMTGSRGADLPPVDCLKELRDILMKAPVVDSGGDADKRRLMAILRGNPARRALRRHGRTARGRQSGQQAKRV